MPLAAALADFGTSLSQCDSLIANAHKLDAAGSFIFPQIDREQITVAAFLNSFIAWETFLESSLAAIMVGSPTLSGNLPVRYVAPPDAAAARSIIVGVMRYFDYGNHENVRKIVKVYFENGYPYEPHISGVISDLSDLRTMRNASAHITSTTQTALEGLALRVLGTPTPGISLYSFITTNDPRSATAETVYSYLRNKLLVVAELIAQG